MRVWEDFRSYFDGTRELKERAVALAGEREIREKTREMEAELGAIAASPVIREFRDMVLGQAGALMPDETIDAAGAFWYRKGLERAVNMLDHTLATAEDENE